MFHLQGRNQHRLTCSTQASPVSGVMASAAPLQSGKLGNVQPKTNSLVSLFSQAATRIVFTVFPLTDA